MSLSPSIDDRPKRLVDQEFRPGELPAADTPTIPVVLAGDVAQGGTPRPSAAAWLAFVSGAILLAAIVAGAVVSLATSVLRGGSIIDLVLLVATVVFAGSIGWLGARQARAFARLKSAERARGLAAHLARLGGVGSGTLLIDALRRLYADNGPVLGALQAVSLALQPHHTDRDVVELLNREVFAPMDRAADERIQRAALRASIGVSACPHPALDALVVLGVAVALIRDLMGIYGLRHSLRALVRIFTRVLFTASSTAVMSTVVEFAMKAAHDRLAAAIAGTAGEALIVARRMFALGALAKQEIRPLPLAD